MNRIILVTLLALVLGMGCGGDPDKRANALYVEAVGLISLAESKTGLDAIKHYEKAIENIEKIIVEYSESDLAVKLVSGETLFNDKSLEQIKTRYHQLKNAVERARNPKPPDKAEVSPTKETFKKFPEHLEQLNLKGQEMNDLTQLVGLTRLQSLNLNDNQVSDLTPLAGLTQLKSLNLNYNQVNDLTPLGKLVRLEFLELRENQISDLLPLATLINIKHLNLRDNEITNLKPLMGLMNLKTLILYGNPDLTNDEIDKLQKALPNCEFTLTLSPEEENERVFRLIKILIITFAVFVVISSVVYWQKKRALIIRRARIDEESISVNSSDES